MKKFFSVAILLMALCKINSAQTIRVHPTGVNVNSQNPTTVFLTFGQIPKGYVPAESLWCGELIPAVPPALGRRCRPGTIYGALPARYNLTQSSGNSGLTDIMAIPPSVVRRAFQTAQSGGNAGFFYVRRFISTTGQPDQFVSVTCRMAGGGARVPFALTNVEIKTPTGKPVLFIKAGEKFPDITAEIQYNGTGRLKGRWEIVQPGEEPPENRDLLTEATLPLEQRGSQRRFTQISRFNHFLPPVGKFKLPLEIKEQIPVLAAGQYILLLRIEATDEKESDSNLAALGIGEGIVHSGAVASFPMPTLKFFIVGDSKNSFWKTNGLVLPQKNKAIDKNQPLTFSWKPLNGVSFYRLEVMDESGKVVLSAIKLSPATFYRAPSWFWSKFGEKTLFWHVAGLDDKGQIINRTVSQKLSDGE